MLTNEADGTRQGAPTRQDQTYQRLRHAIMVGDLQPESALTIRGLAHRFGLSPTPIREVVRRLVAERAIDLRGNRRLAIPAMTADRFDEILALRVTLEGHAATRALPYVSDRLIDAMDRIDREMDDHLARGDMDALTTANHAFHRALYTANPHQATMPAIESVWLQLGPFQRRILHEITRAGSVDRHKEVLRALHRRDAQALGRGIAADIRDGIGRAGRAMLSPGA